MRKDIYKDAKNGFKQNPQNINRTGQNAKPISKILKDLLQEKIIAFELILYNENGEKKVKKVNLKSKTAWNEVCAMILLQKAISGDMKAMETILDRTEGKPIQLNINENTETVNIDLENISTNELIQRLELLHKLKI